MEVKNHGRGVAENCTAYLTMISTNAKKSPSSDDKSLIWENEDKYMTIGAKKGKAKLYIVFSQSNYSMPQIQHIDPLPEEQKVYAKICTLNSVKDPSQFSFMLFLEDGLGIGETCFKLNISSIHGKSTEAKIRIKVTNNWQEISLEKY